MDNNLIPHKAAQLAEEMKQGPFIRIGGCEIITLEGSEVLISKDEGKTWEHYPFLDSSPDISIGPYNLLQTAKGVIIAGFADLGGKHWTWSNELHDAPGARLPTYVVRSLDGGKTWQKPKMIHEEWTGSVRDILETDSGAVVLSTMIMMHNPGRHAIVTYRSADQGETWQRSNIIDFGGMGHHDGLLEATIENLKNGTILMLIRTNWGQFWRAESHDDGRTWHPYGPSGISASSAPAMLNRLNSGRMVLVWNRYNFEDTNQTYPIAGGDGIFSAFPASMQRSELSIAFSDDDTQTWSEPIVIAAVPKSKKVSSSYIFEPDKELSYPHIFEPEPGILWITTTRGDLRMKLHEKDFVSHKKMPQEHYVSTSK